MTRSATSPYTGALTALAAGIDPRLGLFAATIAVGFGLGLLGGRGAANDVAIGTIFAWVLGLGVFFLLHHPRESAEAAGNVRPGRIATRRGGWPTSNAAGHGGGRVVRCLGWHRVERPGGVGGVVDGDGVGDPAQDRDRLVAGHAGRGFSQKNTGRPNVRVMSACSAISLPWSPRHELT